MQYSGNYQDMGNFLFRLAFPNPNPTYSLKDNGILTLGENEDRVVIRFIKRHGSEKCKRIIIFFHGNGEDVGQAEYLMDETMNRLQAHMVCVEYPQYGAYKWSSISQQRIYQDAQRVYTFVQQTVKLQENQIVIVGRSMGGGPATYLASKNKRCGGLVLISPFRSFRSVFNEILLPSQVTNLIAMTGMAFSYYLFKEKKKLLIPTISGFALLSPSRYLLSAFVPNNFNNEQHIQAVEAPTLLIHGRRDTLITKDHSETLFDKSKATHKHLVIRDRMTHNDVDPERDVAEPIENFFRSIQIPDLPDITGQQLVKLESQ